MIKEQAKDLWQMITEHWELWFVGTVVAYSSLHYDLYGPSAHLITLPFLSVAVFFLFPLWPGVWVETSDKLARFLATLGAAVAMGAPLYWAYAKGGRRFLNHDGTPMILGCLVGGALIFAAIQRGKVDLARYGLGLGDFKWWGPPVGFLLFLIVTCIPLVAYFFPEFVAYYPRYKPGRTNFIPLMQYQVAMAVYMFGWEFLFRGITLFHTERKLGEIPAIIIQTWPFYILHHQKPELEYMSSWFGGILMGWLCIRARCMWPSFLLHSVLYSTMEISAYFIRNGLG